MIGRYWWSQKDKTNKIHWIGWPKLTRSKKLGGLRLQGYVCAQYCYVGPTSLADPYPSRHVVCSSTKGEIFPGQHYS
jgi:hypothetical protein